MVPDSNDMSYSDYLHLDEVLSAQHPLSPDHNELLFIVQHQTSEPVDEAHASRTGGGHARRRPDDLQHARLR